jgi:hypothetical protein
MNKRHLISVPQPMLNVSYFTVGRIFAKYKILVRQPPTANNAAAAAGRGGRDRSSAGFIAPRTSVLEYHTAGVRQFRE